MLIFRRVEIMPELLTYGSRVGKYSFVISFDTKYPDVGWRASWKNATYNGPQPANYIGEAHNSREEAEQECKLILKQLLRTN